MFYILIIVLVFSTVIEITKNAKWESKTNKQKLENGNKYENIVVKTVLLLINGRLFRNVIIPTKNGNTTEADIVVASQKGLFCIECKYHDSRYTSLISGDVNNVEWDVNGRYNSTMKNPVKQNKYHIYNLAKVLNISYNNIFNMVVMNNDFNITGNTDVYSSRNFKCDKNSNTIFIKINENYSVNNIYSVKRFIKALPDKYTKEELKNICSVLSTMEGTKQMRKNHVNNLKKRKVKWV